MYPMTALLRIPGMTAHEMRASLYRCTRPHAPQVLAIWSIFTFLLFICTLGLNLALATLFILLTITFALLSAGVTHATTNKVGGAPWPAQPVSGSGSRSSTTAVPFTARQLQGRLVRR